MISFDNVTKRYPNGYDALSQVNFSLDKGEMAFLTGHSGAGKSTLLKLLMLMERPSNGRVLMGDQDLASLGNSQIPYHRRRVGVVDRKSTRLNSSHITISYAVFCLKKKNKKKKKKK